MKAQRPVLLALATTSSLSAATALPSADKQPSTVTIVTGDSSGSDVGVYAYAKIKWLSPSAFYYKLYVIDSRADGNSVYAWLRVYSEDKSWDPKPIWAGNTQVQNYLGHGGGEEVLEKSYQSPIPPGSDDNEILTGARIKACVDDAFANTCTENSHGDFAVNDFA